MEDKKAPPSLGDYAKRAFDNLTPKEQRVLRMSFGLSPQDKKDERLAREAWLERLCSKPLKNL